MFVCSLDQSQMITDGCDTDTLDSYAYQQNILHPATKATAVTPRFHMIFHQCNRFKTQMNINRINCSKFHQELEDCRFDI